jgi:hypothetical protein
MASHYASLEEELKETSLAICFFSATLTTSFFTFAVECGCAQKGLKAS